MRMHNPLLLENLQGTGEISAGLLVDGLMMRDLTSPPTAKHAFILRPLPTRANRLTQFAAAQRSILLRYVAVRPAVQRCAGADASSCIVVPESATLADRQRQTYALDMCSVHMPLKANLLHEETSERGTYYDLDADKP